MTKPKRDVAPPRLPGHGRHADQPGYIDLAGNFHGVNNLSSLAATIIQHEHRGNKPLTLGWRDPDGIISFEQG